MKLEIRRIENTRLTCPPSWSDWYARGLPAGDLASLRRLARRYSRDVVLAPYPGLPSPITLTAWGRIESLDHSDESRVATFVERLRGRYNHGWTRPDDCSPRGARPRAAAPTARVAVTTARLAADPRVSSGTVTVSAGGCLAYCEDLGRPATGCCADPAGCQCRSVAT
jgi:hypothetical protein